MNQLNQVNQNGQSMEIEPNQQQSSINPSQITHNGNNNSINQLQQVNQFNQLNQLHQMSQIMNKMNQSKSINNQIDNQNNTSANSQINNPSTNPNQTNQINQVNQQNQMNPELLQKEIQTLSRIPFINQSVDRNGNNSLNQINQIQSKPILHTTPPPPMTPNPQSNHSIQSFHSLNSMNTNTNGNGNQMKPITPNASFQQKQITSPLFPNAQNCPTLSINLIEPKIVNTNTLPNQNIQTNQSNHSNGNSGNTGNNGNNSSNGNDSNQINQNNQLNQQKMIEEEIIHKEVQPSNVNNEINTTQPFKTQMPTDLDNIYKTLPTNFTIPIVKRLTKERENKEHHFSDTSYSEVQPSQLFRDWEIDLDADSDEIQPPENTQTHSVPTLQMNQLNHLHTNQNNQINNNINNINNNNQLNQNENLINKLQSINQSIQLHQINNNTNTNNINNVNNQIHNNQIIINNKKNQINNQIEHKIEHKIQNIHVIDKDMKKKKQNELKPIFSVFDSDWMKYKRSIKLSDECSKVTEKEILDGRIRDLTSYANLRGDSDVFQRRKRMIEERDKKYPPISKPLMIPEDKDIIEISDDDE